MKQTGCEREVAVATALRRGEATAEVREHARACLDCGEAARLAAWMAEAAASGPSPALPEPAVVRLKAQLLWKNPADQKALRPIHLIQQIALGLVAFGWALLLSWKWDALSSLTIDRTLVGAVTGTAISPSLIAVVAGLACATVAVTAHAALSE